jgi:hypothetical protein
MLCSHCDAEFTPKHPHGRFCSSKCRAAAWQRKREDKLASMEEQAAPLLMSLRVFQGKY